MTSDLLGPEELAPGFEYPAHFVRVVELGLTRLEPWQVLTGSDLRHRMAGLATRYPARRLIPFAARQDCDDVACWSADDDGRVFIIHDYASPGWELSAEVDSFHEWLRLAIDDFIDFV